MTTPSPPLVPAILHRYRLRCGSPTLAAGIARSLQQLNWEVGEQAPLGLLIDAPWGVALQVLSQENPGEWVVITNNPCPEYWEDVWAYRPRGLLAGNHSVEDIAESLRCAHLGEFVRRAPRHDSRLTSIERRLLRYSAMSWDNRRIAQELKLHEGTVRNGLSRVFQKLGFENRTQVALYYWGLWHLLDTGNRG